MAESFEPPEAATYYMTRRQAEFARLNPQLFAEEMKKPWVKRAYEAALKADYDDE